MISSGNFGGTARKGTAGETKNQAFYGLWACLHHTGLFCRRQWAKDTKNRGLVLHI